jgi:hypothetical protein
VENASPPDTPVRKARHNVRGRIHALKLCVTALEILTSGKEEAEFLQMIEQAADGMVLALDELDALLDQAGASQT